MTEERGHRFEDGLAPPDGSTGTIATGIRITGLGPLVERLLAA